MKLTTTVILWCDADDCKECRAVEVRVREFSPGLLGFVNEKGETSAESFDTPPGWQRISNFPQDDQFFCPKDRR